MSSIFEGFLSTPEMTEAFGERALVEAMLRFEAALARAQATCGLIPESAALSIIGTCKVGLFDVARIVRDSAFAGSLAIPMVNGLKETVGLFNPQAVPFVHFGCTSQDAIDTAMAMISRDALALIDADVGVSVQALLALAEVHADTPVLARTLMQPASVTSFGFKCAGWVAPLIRSRDRLRVVAPRALKLQLGGAVGTLASMHDQGEKLVDLVATELGLTRPLACWHNQRDEWVALGCELGLLAGSLGKIARDIALMSQFEVGELAEPAELGRGGPASMPHKRNPVASMVAVAAAQRVPLRVAALLAAMPQEHERALGAWQAELAEWPLLMMAVHGSARAMAGALPGLSIDTLRMTANLDAMRSSLTASAADEWFAPTLARHAGVLARARLAALRASA